MFHIVHIAQPESGLVEELKLKHSLEVIHNFNLFKVIVTVLILGVNNGISIFGSTHPLICI